MDSVTKISHWTYLLQIVCNFKCDFQPWRYINKGRLSYVITTKSVSETIHTGKPGMLQSRPFFRSQRFGHDWVTELCVTNIWFLLMLHIHHRSDILSHIASPLVAHVLTIWSRTCPQCGRREFNPWIGKIPWRRERLPAPVFWPEEFHGQRSLAGYSPRGRRESDTTERLFPFTWVSSVLRLMEAPLL